MDFAVIFFKMILPGFKINIAPILAGMGVLGLAAGMAVRDMPFFVRFFIALEGRYEIGDKMICFLPSLK